MTDEYLPGLVSVVMPTFNRERLTVRALDSVWRQSYRPVEVLVVDDGSTDLTATTARQWAEQFSSEDFFVQIISKENGGAPSARNLALQLCRGEYIQFLDSDDVIRPAKLQLQVRILESNRDVEFVWSDAIMVTGELDENVLYSEAHETSVIFQEFIMGETYASVVKGLCKRSICARIGPWDEDLGRHQDWEYNIRRIALNCKELYQKYIGYVVFVDAEDRISSINHDRGRSIRAGLKAASIVSSKITNSAPIRARVRVAQMYSNVLALSLKSQDSASANAAIRGIRAIIPFPNSVRIKNEIIYMSSQLGGDYFSEILLNLYSKIKRKN